MHHINRESSEAQITGIEQEILLPFANLEIWNQNIKSPNKGE